MICCMIVIVVTVTGVAVILWRGGRLVGTGKDEGPVAVSTKVSQHWRPPEK